MEDIMKGALTLKNNKRSIIWIGAVVLVTVLSLIVAFLLINRERELDEYRDALIDTLLEKAGEYDERSVVLNNTSPAKARKIANMLGAELRISGDGKFAALTVPEGTTILDVVRNDANREILSDISIDFSARIFDTEGQRDTSEPDYSVSDTLYELQAYLDYINLQAIWASTKGRGVTVAVIDTGLDYDHPEFAGRISEYSYNASSGKIVKDCLLADGSYDYSIIDDPNGHGTAVAGQQK